MTSIAEKIAETARAFIALLVAAIRALFGGAKEAAVGLAGDARRIGRAAHAAGSYTAAAVGTGLAGPLRALDLTAGAVGDTLGALLPRRPVGPADVADGAVARDDRAAPVARRTPVPRAPLSTSMLAVTTQLSAAARLREDAECAAEHDAVMPVDVVAWLNRLTAAELGVLAEMHPATVMGHITGTAAALGLQPVAAPTTPTISRDSMRRMLAEIQANARNDRAEVAAMAARGPRPAVLPTVDDEEDHEARRGGPRPAFG